MSARVAVITDLSGYGKSSLSVMIPALEMAGVEVCAVPTALLSTQSDGFLDPYCFSCDEAMEGILSTWNRLGLRFDGIYTGYFTSGGQIELCRDFIRRQKRAFYLCDPVFGDHGAFYEGMDERIMQGIKTHLVPLCDMLTPNSTEAAFLEPSLGVKEITEESEKGYPFSSLFRTVITGVEATGESFVSLDGSRYPYLPYPVHMPGAGDLFSAVLLAQMVKNGNIQQAVECAITITALAVERSASRETRLGVDVGQVRRELVSL